MDTSPAPGACAASKDKVRDVFKDVDFVDGGVDGEIGFVTSVMSENDFKAKAGSQ